VGDRLRRLPSCLVVVAVSLLLASCTQHDGAQSPLSSKESFSAQPFPTQYPGQNVPGTPQPSPDTRRGLPEALYFHGVEFLTSSAGVTLAPPPCVSMTTRARDLTKIGHVNHVFSWQTDSWAEVGPDPGPDVFTPPTKPLRLFVRIASQHCFVEFRRPI
jgi:hypothetical protein